MKKHRLIAITSVLFLAWSPVNASYVEEDSNQLLLTLSESSPSCSPKLYITKLGNHKVSEYNVKDGKKIRDIKVGKGSCSIAAKEDRLYVLCSDGDQTVKVINIRDGKKIRDISVITCSGPLVVLEKKWLYIASLLDDRIVEINIENGKKRKISVEAPFSIAAWNNRLYVASGENDTISEFIGSKKSKSISLDPPPCEVSEIAVWNNRFYVIGDAFFNYKLSEFIDGKKTRDIFFDIMPQALTVHRDLLYVLCSGGIVRIINIRDGKKIRDIPVDKDSRTFSVTAYNKEIDDMEKSLMESLIEKNFSFSDIVFSYE